MEGSCEICQKKGYRAPSRCQELPVTLGLPQIEQNPLLVDARSTRIII